MIIFFILILAGCHFVWVGSAAGSKGHGEVPWAIAGLFFGPFAALAVAAQPDLTTRRYIKIIAGKQDEFDD